MKPASSTERLVRLDTLRGVALGGVLAVNLLTVFRVSLAGHIVGVDDPLGFGGRQLLRLVSALIEFKAFTLFSFLFGIGVAIQVKRSTPGKGIAFLLRRFGALLAIGIFHMLLLWDGDILTLYACCGFLLILLLRLPQVTMVALGLLLIGLPYVVSLPVSFPNDTVLDLTRINALHIYGAGSWYDILTFRLHEIQSLVIPLLKLSFPRTLGLMLWGIAAWRQGFLEHNKALWQWISSLGLVIGIVCLITQHDAIAEITLAFAYAAALFLWNPHLPRVAALGQMALTNYLLQSVVLGFIFYGYGFGMFGRVGVGAALLGGTVFYSLQLASSLWWLNRFYYGPVEWLWRSISYLQWQPFQRAPGSSI